MSPGRLLIGATPLGQPSDASARLISALGSADVVAAEDTRRIRTLARALDVTLAGKVVSLFDANEASRVPALVGEIEAGEAFQAVPSQRFEMDTNADPIDVYRMLRVSNPSPYMYLLNIPKIDGSLELLDWARKYINPESKNGLALLNDIQVMLPGYFITLTWLTGKSGYQNIDEYDYCEKEIVKAAPKAELKAEPEDEDWG